MGRRLPEEYRIELEAVSKSTTAHTGVHLRLKGESKARRVLQQVFVQPLAVVMGSDTIHSIHSQ